MAADGRGALSNSTPLLHSSVPRNECIAFFFVQFSDFVAGTNSSALQRHEAGPGGVGLLIRRTSESAGWLGRQTGVGGGGEGGEGVGRVGKQGKGGGVKLVWGIPNVRMGISEIMHSRAAQGRPKELRGSGKGGDGLVVVVDAQDAEFLDVMGVMGRR